MTGAIRREVMAEIITFMSDADGRGADPWKSAEAAFPGIPVEVLAEAWLEIEHRKTEAWWQSIERTIDGEIIRNALANRDTE